MSDHDRLEDAVEDFVVDFGLDAMDGDDRTAAIELLRDQVGVQIGLSVLPWSRSALSYARSSGRAGPSSVLASDVTLDPADAAFVNATYGHGFEYDDAHGTSDGHPGSAIVAASIAVGEDVDATLGEVLEAAVVGYEVYTRVGELASPDLIARGFHPHAAQSPFGAAAAAAKLWDLDREVLRNGMAIAASHASGLTEYSSTGGSVKRAHAGVGTRNGIEAVRMAREGITGPRNYLSGNKGFYRAFAGPREVGSRDFDRDRLEIHQAWLKQYACCGCTHAYIDCVHALDPDPERIERVEARIQPKSNSIVGLENENLYAPTNIEEAQFNLPFEVSLAILGHGNGLPTHRKFVEGDLAYDAPEIRGTMEKIDLVVDEKLADEYDPKFVGDLTVTYADGTEEHAFVEDTVGTPENPAGTERLRTKFDEVTNPVLGEEHAARLWEFVTAGDLDRPIADLTALM